METIKSGDKVKRVRGGSCGKVEFGGIYTVDRVRGASIYLNINGVIDSYDLENFDLVSSINSNKTINNMLDKFKIMMKGEPQKSFCKSGITDVNYNLTEDGTQIFLQWLLKTNGEAFKTEVVDGLLAEDKK